MIKKQSIYKFLNFTILLLVALSMVLPAVSFAQYSSEGQGEQDVRYWRSRSSSFDRKINNLDNDKITELPLPILFGMTPDNLSSNFGDPRSGGRKHEGLDIMAPKRAPIVSPTEAVVIRIGTGDSSGKHVYTANPGGETFVYMHLDEIADIDEGDELEKGALIGYVGNTGNASGGAPHLHFEIKEDGDAKDPFPRIKRIFPIADKINYLKEILDNADDSKKLAEAIVTMYRADLLFAKTLNIVLPTEIETALKTVPVSTTMFSTQKVTTSSSGDLKLGSKGTAVVALQKFLISKKVGSASKIVADGSFGPITQKALAEYQSSVGIKPASGYYGPITRAHVASNS